MSVCRVRMSPEGPEFSRFAFGLWRLSDGDPEVASPQNVLKLIHACLDLGITTFDGADVYGSFTNEARFGAALALEPGLREKIQIVSKCACQPSFLDGVYVNHYNASREHILASVEKTLRDLGTTYIDLLLIHRPDPLMNAHEVAETMQQLRSEHKVRHFGVSNFSVHQFELLQSALPFPLVTNQIEISPVHVEALFDGTLDQMQRLRRAPMAWSVLGGGALFNPKTPAQERVVAALHKVAAELGPSVSIDQVAYAWVLKHPSNIVVVLGTYKIERLRNAAAAEHLQLTRQQWYYILEAAQGRSVP
eukprot:TRINITY_DN19564_c0_g1_i1.p1 TRINITY_DN19564_c0_g1~~TRINITY_DN19564_c0_g1_i1.p1  ORF type:complete len:320 (+),score=111.52 TRINITY_DN19564_c0_g1_i1:44-961(+)